MSPIDPSDPKHCPHFHVVDGRCGQCGGYISTKAHLVDVYRREAGTKVVTESKRIRALPREFGNKYLIVESSVFTMAQRILPAYFGGYWDFIKLANGGFYMAPRFDGLARLSVAGNGFEGEVSSDAAGIVVCMMTYSSLSFSLQHDTEAHERIVQHFHKVREYVGEHPEASAIFAAID